MGLNLRKEDIERLRYAKEILEKEFKNHYTIEQLAQKVGTNDFKLKRGFKQLFGATPFDYLTQVRIEKAKYLLEMTQYPVKTVGYIVGFPIAGNFIRRFKMVTGYCPAAWRRDRCCKVVTDIFEVRA